MLDIRLSLNPVGVKRLEQGCRAAEGVPCYRGTSYCDAVRRATYGEELLLKADSITVCQWAPIILGFKEPENPFERRLSPRWKQTEQIYLALPDRFKERALEPDLILIRDRPEILKELLEALGWSPTATGGLDRSAMPVLRTGKATFKARLTRGFNRLLYLPGDRRWWRKTTELLFRSTLICSIFDRLISFLMADMSVCRNSSVIPYLEHAVNVSYFCSGGIAWGGNHPDHLTAGFPYNLFRELESRVQMRYPESLLPSELFTLNKLRVAGLGQGKK